MSRPTAYQMQSAAKAPDDVLERVKSGGIDRIHIAHDEHESTGSPRHRGEGLLELLARAEEERPVDRVDLHAWRDLAPLLGIHRRIRRRVVGKLAGERAHVGNLRHPFHEEECGRHQADLDRGGEIHEHGEEEREQHDDDVALGARSSKVNVRQSAMW